MQAPLSTPAEPNPKGQIKPDRRDPFWRIGRYFVTVHSINKLHGTRHHRTLDLRRSHLSDLHRGDRLELPKGHQHPQGALQGGIHIHTDFPGRLFPDLYFQADTLARLKIPYLRGVFCVPASLS